MPLPKYILVSRSLLTKRPVAAVNALRLFHLAGVVAACEEDAQLARTLSDNVVAFQKPVAIVADFPEELRTINDDGSVDELEAFEEQAQETPILIEMN